uniref:Uncharacterized protein n=1 Tax=Arundo donax TaxID=35708 RepID=A0A0A9GLK2_ARUDO
MHLSTTSVDEWTKKSYAYSPRQIDHAFSALMTRMHSSVNVVPNFKACTHEPKNIHPLRKTQHRKKIQKGSINY